MRAPASRRRCRRRRLRFAGCAAYQPPPLTAAHPAHPDAPAARAVARVADPRLHAGGRRRHPRRRAGGAARTATTGHRRRARRPWSVKAKSSPTTPASGQIVVDHGEIKGFMDAMTMGYRIEPPSLLATVKPGDKIRFTIDVDRRAIVHIEKLP